MWRKFKEYPFIHAVAIAMMGSALNLLLATGPSPRGGFTIGSFAVAAFVSGFLIITGLQWRGSMIMSNGIERAGHYLAMAVWFIDAFLLYNAGGTVGLTVPAVLCLASFLRANGLRRHNKDIVQTVHQLRTDDGGG